MLITYKRLKEADISSFYIPEYTMNPFGLIPESISLLQYTERKKCSDDLEF